MYSNVENYNINSSFIEKIIKKEIKRPFLGLQTSGKLHFGHYLLLKAIKKNSEKSNSMPTIYLADLHAKINKKENTEYYCEKTKEFMNYFFKNKVNIVTSKEIKNKEYFDLVTEFLNKATVNMTLRGLPEDLKKINKKSEEKERSLELCYLIYVVYQAVDPYYFNCDTVFCGLDQRRIYAYAYDVYRKLKWDKFNLIMYPLLSKDFNISKYEEKMSSSKKETCFLDQDLYITLKKYFEKESLTVIQEKTMSFLKKCTDIEVLKLFEVNSNESFLRDLHQDLKFMQSFTW